MSVRIYKLASSSASGTQGEHTYFTLGSGASTSNNVHASLTTTLTTTANLVVCTPYIPNNTITIRDWSIFCTTSAVGALGRIMIYDNSTNYLAPTGTDSPKNALLISADLNLATTGVKTATNNFTFIAGTKYWLAVQTNSSAVVLTAIPLGNMITIATKPTDGTQLNCYTGSLTFASGAQSGFKGYASAAIDTKVMPVISINLV